MVAVKRKAPQGNDYVASKKRQPAFVDPYIDPSDDEEESENDQMGEDLVEGSSSEESGQEEGSDEDEGDMEVDENDQEDGENVNADARKPKSSVDKLYKAPTNEEMQQLKETTDLFKSNLFKLQIEELLNEVRIDYTKTAVLETALRKIKEILDSAGDIPEASLAEVTSGLQSEGITIPFPHPQPPADAQYKFVFRRPTKVFVVGSYLLKTVHKSPEGSNVDIAVQMPDSMFQEKDNVNYRYFYKRAYYLAVLASEIKKRRSDLGLKLEFEAFQGDGRRPILVIRSKGDGSEYDFSRLGFCIRIFPTIPQNLFTPTRLAPSRNNVRPLYISSSSAEHTPTPHYNAALLLDTGLVAHMNLLHHHATTCRGFRDASVLAKVWLTQRGFTGATGGFNGFLFAMLMGCLLRTNDKNGNRRLGNNFSSYQLLKVTMDFLATHDFEAEPVFMTPDGKPIDDDEFSAQAFVRNYEVVMVDPSGKVNLAAGISRAALDELQYEAQRSMDLFQDLVNDQFDSLFLKKVDQLHLRYDNIARITPVSQPPTSYDTAVALDYPSVYDYLLQFIPALLKKALTNRAKLVVAHGDRLPSWPVNKPPTSRDVLGSSIYVGLILDAESSIRVVEHGPSADDETAAASFRELWGDKSELRRFKDGSILESVLFDCDGTLEQRSLVVGRMVAHLLYRHIGIESKQSLTYWAGQLNKFLRAPGIVMQVPSFQGVMDAFNGFAKNLRHLEGLPLTVTQAVPCAEGLRYTSTFIPQPRADEEEAMAEAYRPYYEPLEVVIEFESSGRWPDDLAAIQLSKRAFYLKIAELYMRQHPGSRAMVSTGQNKHLLDSGYLEVTTKNGYIFRCTIHVERESVLLGRALNPKTAPQTGTTTLELAKTHYTDRYIKSIYHSTRLQNLCLRFPFLPQTIRLAKRWIGAHLLSTQMPVELIELICAKVFVDPSPWAVPNSGFVGFMRVLQLLDSWDWKKEPLIVELESGLLTADVRTKIGETFRISRGLGTNGTAVEAPKLKPVMWVATEQDVDGKWWGWEKPGVVIVERIRRLAGAALKHVGALIQGVDSDKAISKIFIAPPKGYDLIIRLHPSKLPRFRESLSYDPETVSEAKPKFKNLIPVIDRELALLSEIDPVEWYLTELHRAFGDIALFFHDKHGGDAIGVVWNPKAIAPHQWKVNLTFNVEAILDGVSTQVPAKGKKQKREWNVKPNYKAMVAEMYRLGTGLVAGVDMLTHADE